LYKYIFKGGDNAKFKIADPKAARDEIKEWKTGQYNSSGSAMWRCLGYPSFTSAPRVDSMSLHDILDAKDTTVKGASSLMKYLFRPPDLDAYAATMYPLPDGLKTSDFMSHFTATTVAPATVRHACIQRRLVIHPDRGKPQLQPHLLPPGFFGANGSARLNGNRPMWLKVIGDKHYYYYPKPASTKCLFRITPSVLGTEHWYLRHILLNIVVPTAPEGTLVRARLRRYAPPSPYNHMPRACLHHTQAQPRVHTMHVEPQHFLSFLRPALMATLLLPSSPI
jgi:hypothetical protein